MYYALLTAEVPGYNELKFDFVQYSTTSTTCICLSKGIYCMNFVFVKTCTNECATV